MSTAETPDKPTVEELLVSIRQAIHGDNAARASLGKPVSTTPTPKAPVHKFEPRNNLSDRKPSATKPIAASMNQMRVNLKPGRSGARTNDATSADNFSKLREQLYEMGAAPSDRAKPAPKGAANGFAKILSGETRLEDALEKLRSAGLQPASEGPAAPFRDTYATESDEDFRFDDNLDAEDDIFEFDEVEPQKQNSGFSPMVQENYLSPPPTAPVVEQPAPATSVKPAPQQPVQPQRRTDNQAPVSQSVPDTALTSAESAAATNAAFNQLAEAIVGHAKTGNQSIDQVTRELLRPMLKSWLDENLPRLVERLVRDEIERVARGGSK